MMLLVLVGIKRCITFDYFLLNFFFFCNFELNEELVTRNRDNKDIRRTHGDISADPEVFQDPYKFVVLPATFLIS